MGGSCGRDGCGVRKNTKWTKQKKDHKPGEAWGTEVEIGVDQLDVAMLEGVVNHPLVLLHLCCQQPEQKRDEQTNKKT